MKAYFFFYNGGDGFAAFEVVNTALLLRKKFEIITTSFEQGILKSEEKFKFVIDQALADVNPEEVDVLIIPGGDPLKELEDERKAALVKTFLERVNARGSPICAICGGPLFLTVTTILEGKRFTGDGGPEPMREEDLQHFKVGSYDDSPVVVDGTIITAKGQAYTEFAVEVAKKMGLITNEREANETIKWLKNQK